MSGRLRFLTNDVCPFAHRAWLALEEIGAEYEKVDVHIAPGTKEAHFTEAYRASLGANVNADGTLSDGKVPVIDDGGFLMCESVPVAYYLAETRGGGLVPADARDRAAVTIFNDQVGAPVMQKFYPFLMAKTDEAEAKGKADFVAALLALSRALGRRGGPYALGASLSLADVLGGVAAACLAIVYFAPTSRAAFVISDAASTVYSAGAGAVSALGGAGARAPGVPASSASAAAGVYASSGGYNSERSGLLGK